MNELTILLIDSQISVAAEIVRVMGEQLPEYRLSIAKGIAEGRRVRQGQVIGYVGETGIATGPHLDYRVKKDKRYANPLKMTIPASIPVRSEYFDDFSHVVSLRMNYLNRHVDRDMYVMNQ